MSADDRTPARPPLRERLRLLVGLANEETLGQGELESLFRGLGEALERGLGVDRWSLWVKSKEAELPACWRIGGPGLANAAAVPAPEPVDEHMLPPHADDSLGTAVPIAAGDADHAGLLLPFVAAHRSGALAVEHFRAGAAFDDDDLAYLEALATVTAGALRVHFRQRAIQDASNRSDRDPLTGLANASMFERSLRRALERGERAGTGLTLLLIDLDRFKTINLRYGHALGDWLLGEVAGRLLDRVRASDLVARIGGDDFAIVLDSLGDEAMAGRIADKLGEYLQQPYRHGTLELQLGCNIGVACAPAHGSEYERLMDAAATAVREVAEAGNGSWKLAAKG